MVQTNAIFRMDAGSGVPLYRQVIDQVLLAVADGRLKPGMQLPTVRQLAVDLAVNLNTVARAYREMEIRGIVQTQQGTGTFVAAPRVDGRKSSDRKKSLEQLVDRYIAIALSKGFSIEELLDAISRRVEKKERRSS
ncbi:MAG TPA: GntR family transcriptional regulator [Thermoanaerobaculia bacterium]|nr:GntR family transcriptional regulator [Thermoanaerobaculia bacterium]